MSTATSDQQVPKLKALHLPAQLATLAGAELVNRLTRLLTAVALAWALSPFEFGLAAIALTASDILRALTQTGIGARIVAATDENLNATCNAAYMLNWWAYGAVAAVQIVVAFPLAWHYGDPRIAWLLILLTLPYVLYPVVAVQVYRVQRQARMRQTALMLLVLITGDNILTALAAVLGMGLWSLAVPKFLCALVWVAFYLKLETWRPTRGAGKGHFHSTLRFGLTVLLAELAQVLRLHVDKLIIGHLLGLILLGQYFFAFNAGLGISTALITVASTALLPHYSNRNTGETPIRRFVKATGMVYLLVLPVLCLQIFLAPYYVPMIFGEKWQAAVPMLMLMCLMALPLILMRSTTVLLRASGLARLDLWGSLVHFMAGLSMVVAMAARGLEAIIIGQLIVASVIAIGFAAIAMHAVKKGSAQ